MWLCGLRSFVYIWGSEFLGISEGFKRFCYFFLGTWIVNPRFEGAGRPSVSLTENEKQSFCFRKIVSVRELSSGERISCLIRKDGVL